MKHSVQCVELLIKPFETCRLEAYRDGNHILTIGWGYAGPDVMEGLVWQQSKADEMLELCIAGYEAAIDKLVKVPLSQNQFDAVVSLVYNIGPGHFAQSTVLRKLNAQDYPGAADAFLLWVQPGSINQRGLTRRRKAERALFLTAPAAVTLRAAAVRRSPRKSRVVSTSSEEPL